MEPKSLERKTLDELRALARTAGLRGYSGLRKKQLIEILTKPKVLAKARATPKKKLESTTARSKTARTRGAPSIKKVSRIFTAVPVSTDTEERIESAKFQTTPPQIPFRQTFTSSLHEDVDKLPPHGEPVLCLLPQKPGVVHAYWTVQPDTAAKPLRLRLCYATGGSIELLDEVDVRGEQGHWYFHVPETTGLGNVVVHLGYYEVGGEFVTAIERGIARIPTVYASGQTDRSWWISDEDFRALYRRAGGVTHGGRLRWPGDTSSSRIK